MRTRTPACLAVAAACALALGCASPAAADDSAPPVTPTAADHYQRGMTHYNLGEFDAAVREFKAAYELSQAPELLFNVAQAYRLAEDHKQALFFYDAYLRLRPDAENRADVEAWIAASRKLLDDQRQLQQSPPQDAIPPATPPPAAPEPVVAAPVARDVEAHGRPQLRTAGLVVGAAGVASGAAAIYFGLHARGHWNEITELSRSRGTWSDHHADVERSARRSERLALVTGIVGIAATVTGGVLWYVGRDRATVMVTPTGDGGKASITWRF